MFSETVRKQKDWLVEAYFNDPRRKIQVKAGELLLEQGKFNRRIYFLLSGEFKGIQRSMRSEDLVLFLAKPQDFIGIPSFFHPSHRSLTTTVAVKDSVLFYMDETVVVIPNDLGNCFEQQFMGVIQEEWTHRQLMVHQIHRERESMITHMMEHRRLASLGEMSAGVAHELNNAFAVFGSGVKTIDTLIEKQLLPKTLLHLYTSARDKGRSLGTRQVRQRVLELSHCKELTPQLASSLGRCDYPLNLLMELLQSGQVLAEDIVMAFELGVRVHDMTLMYRQASHVVQSMRLLGAPPGRSRQRADLLELVRNAIHLLGSELQDIGLEIETHGKNFSALVERSELVQVIVNLLKNAKDALSQDEITQPAIHVELREDGHEVIIQIRDNAKGISPEHIQNIFNPSFTTKKLGLDFGLGLGLPIVRKLVQDHQGSIAVESSHLGSCFTVRLPKGEQ